MEMKLLQILGVWREALRSKIRFVHLQDLGQLLSGVGLFVQLGLDFGHGLKKGLKKLDSETENNCWIERYA